MHHPFQTDWYQDTFIKHFSRKEDIVFPQGFEKTGDKAVFIGMKPVLNGQEVTDYGDIVSGEPWDEIFKKLAQNGIKTLQLDYVREDSPTYIFFKDRAIEQTVAPYIILPKTWDEYLESLDRVDRKELKRKMRRLETISYMYRSIDKLTHDDFEEFVRLHKLSSGKKDEFMSNEMQAFFWDLITVEKKDWKTTLSFLEIDGKNTASVMCFENGSDIFGYNSGYDPAFNYYSAGLLLHALKIKEAIEKGIIVYDFMRGTERYKYDLGGKDMKLYRVEIHLQK